ncbi:MAG: ABC transporter permease [bacterium]|nr:ABC transporter permease [bacterium]
MRKIKFIATKEFYHILRDPKSLAIAIAMPIMMTFLYGYAINLDIEHVTIGIIDYDKTAESKELTDAFYESSYFSRPEVEVLDSDAEALLRSSHAIGLLYIRPGFSDALLNGRQFELGMTIDGSDNNLSAAVLNYSNGLVFQFMLDHLPHGVEIPKVDIATQNLYNPDLKSSHFFVPGLVALILMMISAMLTSITIAREKETGTMEQLLTAPVSPRQILLGKILPYIFLALLDGFLVLVVAKLFFGIPFAGSQLLLFAFGLIYVATALALGILISSLTKTQQVAMMLAQMTTLLPSVMLSGFIFPIKNMPLLLQLISNIVPARFFVVIIRGITLKGAGLEILAAQGLYLIILMAVLMLVAAKKFSTRIA